MTANEAGNARVRHAQEQLVKAEKKRDPESEFYDKLKRKNVIVELHSGKVIVGLLSWISTYSIGVTVDAAPDPTTVLIMKGALATIRIGE